MTDTNEPTAAPAPQAPQEPEPAPAPAPAPAQKPKKAAPKGYDVRRWSGMPLYVCQRCGQTQFDEAQMVKHVGKHPRA